MQKLTKAEIKTLLEFALPFWITMAIIGGTTGLVKALREKPNK